MDQINTAQSRDGNLRHADDTSTEIASSNGPKRRKRTHAEKAASREKALSDEFGASRVDPTEPLLPDGFPIDAARCAIKQARRVARSGKRITPARIALTTQQICGLSSAEHDALLEWLKWLKDRKWALREGRRSLVVTWADSNAGSGELWDAAVDRRVRQLIDDPDVVPVPTHAPAARPATGQTPPPERPRVEAPREKNVFEEIKNFDDPEEDREAASPTPASLDRPKVPYPAFVKEEYLANAFFKALKDQSDDALRLAARKLSEDPERTRATMARGDQHRKCVVEIFRQVGLPLPGTNP